MNRTGEKKLGGCLDGLESSLAMAMALSLPWELYQRIPCVEVTIAKAAGALLAIVVAARMVYERRWRVGRTGLDAPLLALLAVMAASTLTSTDARASLGQLAVYASYFAVFWALSGVVNTEAKARRLAGAFVASSAAVGALAIACRLGLATPTLVETTRITGRWTTRDTWFDLTSRMAPASVDFNQGVLPLLAAFCLVLFLFSIERKRRPGVALLAGLLSLAGIFISLSRSTILLAVVLAAAFAVLGVRRGARRPVIAFAVSALLAMAALAIVMRPQGVLQRATNIFHGHDSSYAARVAALEAGWSLIPEYWRLGTGLGASDSVIARSAYGAQVGGITIHSVPFKLLVETGVAGLLALAWFYWRALRVFLRGMKSDNPELRAHCRAFLAVGATLLAITAMQPFMALSLFPFLLGIAAGPVACAGRGSSEANSDDPRRAWAAVVTLCVAGIVLFNLADFHRTVERLWRLADALVQGVTAERAGDLEQAAQAYTRGFSAATGLETPSESEPAPAPRFYQQAAEVLDVSYAYERMGVRCRRVNPTAACAYGMGRVAFAQGAMDDAASWLFEALKYDGEFAQAHFTLAEVWWEMGEYKKAIVHYGKAGDLESIRENAEFRKFTAPIDEYIAAHNGDADTATHLRRAEFLRRRGRWPEAVEEYKGVLDREPGCAEALFNLGVQREVEGAPEKALAFYRQAVSSSPQHYETVRRLKGLAANEGANRVL